ncbi:alpha/beta fold hydrolase [Polymorphospora rubra]|uniref:Arylesterase n=1 Tax=Polymorphospora rubra TaxID=338584 RepID=A0A810N787_9ACTN|nr:alpha/beta hydrolase [Polymorphospora rubra]BCJ67503.1 arylesterase [Polymorphospora rubra]
MPYVTVGTENSAPIDLYYEDHGSGQPVVLIHGFPLSSAAWEKQVPALLMAGYRTIAYDRRGFGQSAQPTSGYDYDTFASDLNMLINELDLSDVVLIGHSMGTGEVTRYLGTYGSDRISRAVLVSTIPPYLLKTSDNPEGVDKALFDGFQQAIVADRYAYQTSFLNDFFNYDQTRGKQVSEEAYRANWNVAVSASPIGTYECVSSWLTDFRADVARIDVPTLIIHGDADRVLPYPLTAPRLNAMLPDSELVTLPGAPHAIPWTHADEVNNAIMQFIGARTPAMSRKK